ncbi:tetratricopeptide repeat protein [Flammeovirga aprica]|uniref:Tetratricopeptide repeat protein n=1 Tax=Flammeovirga aprica JL-4 TaxID=694437 RepID=A0A7X9RTG8_9BACT|nr:tetratricopeptide repeat protein [Flammeovirga aprica]NME67294.1 hypothetical protein [Flammeovirga aprica JL-4]
MKQTIVLLLSLLWIGNLNAVAQKAAEKKVRINMLIKPLQILNGHASPYQIDGQIADTIMPPCFAVKAISTGGNKTVKSLFDKVTIVGIKKYDKGSSSDQLLAKSKISNNGIHGYDYALEYYGGSYTKKLAIETIKTKQGDSTVVTYTPYAEVQISVNYKFKHVDGTLLLEKNFTGEEVFKRRKEIGGAYASRSLALSKKKELGSTTLANLEKNVQEDFYNGIVDNLNNQFGYSCRYYTFKLAMGKGKKHDYSASEEIITELDEVFKENEKKCFLNQREDFAKTLQPIQAKFKEAIPVWEELIAFYEKGNKKAKVSDKNIAYFYYNIGVAYLFLEEYEKASDYAKKAYAFKYNNKGEVNGLFYAIKNLKPRSNPKVHQFEFTDAAVDKFYAAEVTALKRTANSSKNIADLPFALRVDYSKVDLEKEITLSYRKIIDAAGWLKYQLYLTNNSDTPIIVPYMEGNENVGIVTQVSYKKKGGAKEKVSLENEPLQNTFLSEKSYYLLLPSDKCLVKTLDIPKVKEKAVYEIDIRLQIEPRFIEDKWFKNDNTRRVRLQSIVLDKVLTFDDKIEASEL